LLSVRHLKTRIPHFGGAVIVVTSAMIGWLVLFIPFSLLGVFDGMVTAFAACSLVANASASALFYRKVVPSIQPEQRILRWRAQGLYGGLISILGIIPPLIMV
jgi:hypothetical protein